MKFIGGPHFYNCIVAFIWAAIKQLQARHSSTINNDEAGFLNLYLANKKINLISQVKKLVLLREAVARKIGTRNGYFKEVRECNLRNSKIATSFIAFTDDEKVNSEGYDAIITYWVKISIGDKTKKKIVDKLKSATRL